MRVIKKIKKQKDKVLKRSLSRKKMSTLIVGHNYSNFESVESLLHKNGMFLASRLKKEQIFAKELSNILVPNMSNSSEYKQEKISHVWDGLALDLFLSNNKNGWWGWSDSNAVVLLEYWKNTNPSMFFILVYNSPEEYIKKYLEVNGKASQKKLEKILKDYVAYNKALLEFYYRNKESVFLLNTQEVEVNNVDIYLPVKKNKNIQIKAVESKSTNDEVQDEVLTFLVKNIILEHQELNEIYDELESVANLPLQNVVPQQYSIYNVLKTFQKTKKESTKLQQMLQEKVEKEQKELTTLKQELQNREKSNKELQQTKEELKKAKEKVSDELSKENELLLSQLHLVQEELEKYYLENKRFKEKAVEAKRYYGAAERVKSQLSYRLGAKIIEKSSSPVGLIFLPFSLLAVRGEWKEEQRQSKEKKLPPIDTYADAYEAERVKNHLSYALGETTIETMKNPFGIFILPFRLISTRKEWKKGRES